MAITHYIAVLIDALQFVLTHCSCNATAAWRRSLSWRAGTVEDAGHLHKKRSLRVYIMSGILIHAW